MARKSVRVKRGGVAQSAGFTPQTGFTVSHDGSGFVNGATLTISDSNNRLTAKTNPKPLLWWTADHGMVEPDSTVGRKNTWGGVWPVDSQLSASVAASGSAQSLKYEHTIFNSADACLPLISLDSPQKLYMWRKVYEDYNIYTDWVHRFGHLGVSGSWNVGDVATGRTSGATGIVMHASAQFLYLEPSIGTFYSYGEGGPYSNGESEIIDFSSGGSLTTNGWIKTFNQKIFRFWGQGGALGQNAYINGKGEFNTDYYASVENVGGQTYPSWLVPIRQRASFWYPQEWLYEASTPDAQDGTHEFMTRTLRSHAATGNVMTRTSGEPLYNTLFMHQVSNGCLPSPTYHDALYLDDTWHRIVITDQPAYGEVGTDNFEIQLPITWAPEAITAKLRVGSFASLAGKSLYVIGDDLSVLKIGEFT